ncbi:MAG: hypothetical protein ACOY7J_11645 [Pseudomonadota bacterium]
MSGPVLRVVQEDVATFGHGPVTVALEATNPDLSFDPELDLGAIEEEESDRIAESREPVATSKSVLGRMFRWIAFGFGGLVMVLVVLVLVMRGNKAPGNVPPVTAKVDVLEAAMQEQEESAVEEAIPTATAPAEETELPASIPDFQPPITLAPTSAALAAAPAVASVDAASSARDEILAVIGELRQVTNTLREGYAEQQAHIHTMQGELALLQASSEATNMRVDGIAADFAQLRRSLDDVSSQKSRQATTLQRQLTTQKRELEMQKAVRQEKPTFLLAGVTVWGSDYLATVSANGLARDLGQGDIFEGWKVTSLSASSITLVRLQDGVTATLGVRN